MKKLIALLLSIFTILLVSTSAFAFGGGGITGGVNGDGDFTGGGFTGGSRLGSVFGSSPPASSSLSTMLSYEALNNLTANINLGISLGEIEILDGNIQAVTVTKRTDWNAYVITGDYNGNTYVIVNASGGRYYSPINEGYTISAIAGTSNYFLTDRPVGTVGNGYLGDLQVTYDNWMNIKNILDSLSGNRFYYAYGHSINGEYRYYLTGSGFSQTYYVCNSAGQLFYYVKDEGSTTPPDSGGSTFDPTEVITAINSVYDAITAQGNRVVNSITQLITSANSIGNTLNMHMNNVVDGFDNLQNNFSTLNGYFSDLSGLFPVQEEITLLGSDTRVAWDSADRITNVAASGFNGDLIVKQRPGPLVDESGYEKVTINETEYRLYNDSNGYRRVKTDISYPNEGGKVLPTGTLFYFPFEDTLSSSVGDAVLTTSGTPEYSVGLDGSAYLFNGSNSLTSNSSGVPSSLSHPFTYCFWFYPSSFPSGNSVPYYFQLGNSLKIYIAFTYDGKVSYSLSVTGSSGVISTYGMTTDNAIPLNEWMHFAIVYDGSQIYYFLNGDLSHSTPIADGGYPTTSAELTVGKNVNSGCMVDNFMFVDGQSLWTSDFNPLTDAIFSEVAKDYFLACSDQDITLNFYDTEGEQVTEHRWNQYTVNTSRLPNGYTELDSIQSSGTQYINTFFEPNNNTRVVFDFTYLSGDVVFGSYDSGGANGYGLQYVNGNWYTYYGSSNGIGISAVSNSRLLVDFNKNVVTVNGSPLRTATFNTFQGSNPLLLSALYNATSAGAYSSIIIYSCQIYDNGTLVRDFVPCKNPSNAVGLYDLVNDQFSGNSGTGSFIAGNQVSNGSGIGQLVGVVSSTNANAYPNDGIQGDFYYEYIGSYTEYPSFSQTLSPTDVNGNAIIMGRLEDDFSEIYMDISTMQWYCHDPQTQTEILLSSANQQIMNDTIYVRQNYTTIPADQITADALQNLLPVDSPVYLDMPEGAKLTITYDHYSGWFRMMYILMDKQTKLLSDLDIVNETIINVENTVVDITNNNPAYNVFYITKTDGTTESVGDAAKDVAVFVGDVLSMFYRLVFDDALDNTGIVSDFENTLTSTNSGVDVW